MSGEAPHPPAAANPLPWWSKVPTEPVASLLMLALFGCATASFLIYEKGVARTFGLPLDSGWLDLTLGRALFTGIGEPFPSATESPGYALVLGIVQALASYDRAMTILSVKLLSLVALSFVGWGTLRIVRVMPGTGPYGMLAVAFMLPLSPALIWLGVSGLGLAWGVALVALGLALFVEGKTIRGTAFLGAALWMSPGALGVLVATFLARTERWRTRLIVGVGFAVPCILWHIFAPGEAYGLPGWRQSLVWMRSFLALSGLTPTGGIHPVLLPLLAGLGIWLSGKTGRILWISVLLPPVLLGLVLPGPGMFGRLLFVCLPPLFVLAAIAVEFLAAQVATGFLRRGRLAVLVLAVYVVLSGPRLWQVRQATGWQVENTVQVGEKIGLWLAKNARSAEVVATTAPGAVSYFSGHPILDLTRKPMSDMPLGDVLMAAAPSWVAVNVGPVVPAVLRSHYRMETSLAFRVHAGVYPPGPMVVFRRLSGQGYASSTDPEGAPVCTWSAAESERVTWYNSRLHRMPCVRHPAAGIRPPRLDCAVLAH